MPASTSFGSAFGSPRRAPARRPAAAAPGPQRPVRSGASPRQPHFSADGAHLACPRLLPVKLLVFHASRALFEEGPWPCRRDSYVLVAEGVR